MTPRAAKRLERLRTSLWTLPLLSVAAGIGAGLVLPALDRRGVWADALGGVPLLGLESQAAREVFGTMATALASVLGVLFSLTIIALQLASTQYSPRILRRFMGDRRTKGILALFIAAVAYLLVAISALPDGAATPRLTMLGALLLSLLAFGLVGYFLHHLAHSIDAATIVRSVGVDTARMVERLGLAPDPHPPEPHGEAWLLRSDSAGYLEFSDPSGLLEAAPEETRLIRLEVRTGDFVLPGMPLVALWPAVAPDAAAIRRMRRAIALGEQRGLEQDFFFGVRQLVDVSLKALSPSMNDVTTAFMAVNELGTVLRAFVEQQPGLDDGWRVVRQGERAALIRTPGLRAFLRHAFSEIARASGTQLRVPARILEIMGEVVLALDPPGPCKQAFLEAADWIRTSAQLDEAPPVDRQFFEERAAWLCRVVEGASSSEVPALH